MVPTDAPPSPAFLVRSPDPDLQWRSPSRRAAFSAGTVSAIALLLLPWVVSPYYLIVCSSALVLALACLGLNLVFGHAGLLSFGHATFYGVGAYTGGFIFSLHTLSALEAYLLFGALAATALGAAIGFLCARATRIYFAILTLAFGQVIHSLFISGAIFRLIGGQGRGLFLLGGGGLYIPRFTMGGVEFPPDAFHTALYYVILAVFLAASVFMWRVVNSPFGKALHAIRDNDLRAEYIGVRVRRYRWAAFVLSAAITGLAGGLAGQLDRQVTPDQLYWLFSAKLVLATVVGGHRYLLGPVVGAFAFTGLHEFALRLIQYRSLVLGILLITVVLMFPGGLVGCAILCLNRLRRFLSRASEPIAPQPSPGR